jgi:hypothetical protein
MARRRGVGVSAATTWRKTGGVPWAGGRVSLRAAPSGLKVVARPTARRMAGGNAASTRAAPSQLKAAARSTAARMEVAGGVSTRAAPRQWLQAARLTARRMEAANGAKKRVAPSPLLQAARPTSDELTVLYSNGPDDRSVKLALGYVTAATSGC